MDLVDGSAVVPAEVPHPVGDQPGLSRGGEDVAQPGRNHPAVVKVQGEVAGHRGDAEDLQVFLCALKADEKVGLGLWVGMGEIPNSREGGEQGGRDMGLKSQNFRVLYRIFY